MSLGSARVLGLRDPGRTKPHLIYSQARPQLPSGPTSPCWGLVPADENTGASPVRGPQCLTPKGGTVNRIHLYRLKDAVG